MLFTIVKKCNEVDDDNVDIKKIITEESNKESNNQEKDDIKKKKMMNIRSKI